jgi:sec-independent protein translocase protein TatA
VFNVGPLELIVVLIIALIVLGPQRLPDVARSVGRGMREFRGALESPDDDDEDDDEVRYTDDDQPEPETEAEGAAATTGEGYQKDADSSEPSSSSSERV